MELMKCFLAFVFSSCMIRTVVESQSVSVEPQVTAYLRDEVTLRCQFIKGGSTDNIVEIEWRKESEVLALFHPQHGMNYSKSSGGRVSFTSSSMDHASIRIIDINETDAGKYTCRYTTFPEGSKEATTTLTVKAVESQSVSVGLQVTAYLGGEVTLPCPFIKGGSTDNIAEIEWRKESEFLAHFHPDHGMKYDDANSLGGRVRFTSSSIMDDASISIININETDAGKYTCRYATSLEGKKEATMTLTVREWLHIQADKPWVHSIAVASGIALLLIVLIAAELYFVMMKRRQRAQT